jgi:hypothetical protein
MDICGAPRTACFAKALQLSAPDSCRELPAPRRKPHAERAVLQDSSARGRREVATIFSSYGPLGAAWPHIARIRHESRRISQESLCTEYLALGARP